MMGTRELASFTSINHDLVPPARHSIGIPGANVMNFTGYRRTFRLVVADDHPSTIPNGFNRHGELANGQQVVSELRCKMRR
jgi:hypothetical protein